MRMAGSLSILASAGPSKMVKRTPSDEERSHEKEPVK